MGPTNLPTRVDGARCAQPHHRRGGDVVGEQAPDADISGLQHMKNPIAEANELWVHRCGTTVETDASSFHRRDLSTARALDLMTQATSRALVDSGGPR